MFRIAICDDVMSICHHIEKILIEYAKENLIDIDVEVFYNGETLYDFICNEHRFDLIFLDIEMDALNGVELSQKIRSILKDMDTEIVFVSGTTQYDRQLFEVQPLYFIEKPFDPKKVISSLKLAMDRLEKSEKTLRFHIEKTIVTLRYNSILYVESNNRKVTVVTNDNTYSYYAKLADVENTYPKYFCRIHKSFIINMNHILEFKGNSVTMIDGKILSISSTYGPAFKQLLRNKMFQED